MLLPTGKHDSLLLLQKRCKHLLLYCDSKCLLQGDVCPVFFHPASSCGSTLYLFPQMFVALIFWYQFYCGFSGSAMIDQWYLIFFNLMFSAFPQLITGTLDKDVSAETLQQLPQLYMTGQNSEVHSHFLSLTNNTVRI